MSHIELDPNLFRVNFYFTCKSSLNESLRVFCPLIRQSHKPEFPVLPAANLVIAIIVRLDPYLHARCHRGERNGSKIFILGVRSRNPDIAYRSGAAFQSDDQVILAAFGAVAHVFRVHFDNADIGVDVVDMCRLPEASRYEYKCQ
jgi:hypothetical protein